MVVIRGVIIAAVFSVVVLSSSISFALDVRILSVGDTTYINGHIVGLNHEARIVDIDRSDNRVYVYNIDEDKYQWVSGDALIDWVDKTERNLEQIGDILDFLSAVGDAMNSNQ